MNYHLFALFIVQYRIRVDEREKKKAGGMEEVVLGITVQTLMGRLITTLPCLMWSPCGNRTCFIH